MYIEHAISFVILSIQRIQHAARKGRLAAWTHSQQVCCSGFSAVNSSRQMLQTSSSRRTTGTALLESSMSSLAPEEGLGM